MSFTSVSPCNTWPIQIASRCLLTAVTVKPFHWMHGLSSLFSIFSISTFSIASSLCISSYIKHRVSDAYNSTFCINTVIKTRQTIYTTTVTHTAVSRRMAIANGTCVSFCNQPKAHYLATSGESRRYVVAFTRFAGEGIWLRQESLKNILACPWIRTWDNRRNCYMDGKRIQCLSNASQQSIFNRSLVIQPVSSHVRHFSTFSHILASPGTITKCYMNGKRIQCWSNASQHIPIYLQPFTRYSEILVGNCNFFLPLARNAPVVGVPIGLLGKILVLIKLESWGYQVVKTVWRYVEPFRHNTSVWRTDGQTDVQLIAITCVSLLTHVKN